MKLTKQQAASAISTLNTMSDQIKRDWVVGLRHGYRIYAVRSHGDILDDLKCGPWAYEAEGKEIVTLATSPDHQWTWDNANGMEAEAFGQTEQEILARLPHAIFFEDGSLDWSKFADDCDWADLCDWAGQDQSPLDFMIQQIDAMTESDN